jgi:hypothetical protein
MIAEYLAGNSFLFSFLANPIITEVMMLSDPQMHIKQTNIIAGVPGSPPVCSIPKTINMLVTNENIKLVSKAEKM